MVSIFAAMSSSLLALAAACGRRPQHLQPPVVASCCARRGAALIALCLARVFLAVADPLSGTATPMDALSSPDFTPLPAAAPRAVASGRSVFVGGVTDPGVAGRENQDDFFVWQSSDGRSCCLGVFDGHGRELGKLAAGVAKESFASHLASDDALRELRVRPREVLRAAFQAAHEAIAQVRW
jgi:hypothetical protein